MRKGVRSQYQTQNPVSVSSHLQASQYGFLDFENFDVEEYEHYEVRIIN